MNHLIYFDHLIHLVPDLQAAIAKYEELGFAPQVGGEHPGRGTHNASIRSGPTYIEILGVRDWAEFHRYEEERRRRYPGIEFRTEEALSSGGGAIGFAVRTSRLREMVTTMRETGLPFG